MHYGPREPLERPEEPFAIAVRDIDEYVGCSRLRWGSEASRVRFRLENLDAIKPEGASSNAPFHPRGGRIEHAGTEELSQGTPNKHYYEARTTMGQFQRTLTAVRLENGSPNYF